MEAVMLKGKGLAFAAACAIMGALIWGALSMFTGWNFWFLAPIVGGAAGFGMMFGTKMRGGTSHGIAAAVFAVAAIFTARCVVVSHWTEARLQQEAIEGMTLWVAQDMEKRDGDVYNDAGELKPEVKAKGAAMWATSTESDRRAYIQALRAQNGDASSPLAVFRDFGLFGMIFTALAAGAAFKSAKMSLEHALIMKGLATDSDALNVAASMRAAQAEREKARAEGTALPGMVGHVPPAKAQLDSQDKREAA